MLSELFIEKIYAGFLGMNAGMRLGAPLEEPLWTYQRIREYYGDFDGYLRKFKNFAADDDVNGPVIFLRGLTDWGVHSPLTPQRVAEAWLNYTRTGTGMFWWGGEELSTEHRAFMNLKRGIPAPASGSMACNGSVAAEQIGGQIFIDTWGLIWPGNPAKAAEYARIAASVSHDGEGLHGAAFIAACIAAAFTCTTVDEVLDAGLGELPEDCEYRRVVTAVREFHAAHPGDFRACRDYVDRAWGYHKYPGYCHIIPNAGVCVLALLYGGGVLSRTIEIACMCAMDTDCNASNTGTIVGVLGGLGPIPPKYRDPIHDAVVLSCVSGYLNILDGAAFSEELACIAAALREEALPTRFVPAKQGELRFDFELPGATHGLELSTEATHRIRQTTDRAHTGTGSLALFIDGKQPEDATLSFKAFYCRRDFNDERYSPVFSPRVYPGQTVSVWMYSEQLAPAAVTVVPYLTRALDDAQISFPPTVLPREQWTQVTFTIPDLMGDQAHDVGWAFHAAPEEDIYVFGTVYLDDISVTGPMDYTVEFRLQRKEFGQVTPFSFNQCDGTVENGRLLLTSQGEGQAFTGHYYMTDGFVEADVIPSEGASCALLLRGQGCERYYTLGFEGENRVALVRHGYAQREVLACAPCRCLPGRSCHLKAEALGDKLTLLVDGHPVLEAQDSTLRYGMVGLYHGAAGRSEWSGFHSAGKPG